MKLHDTLRLPNPEKDIEDMLTQVREAMEVYKQVSIILGKSRDCRVASAPTSHAHLKVYVAHSTTSPL